MITAELFHTYYQPHACERRVWLAANRPELRAPLTEYEQILFERGQAHEREHLKALGPYEMPQYPARDLRAGAAATQALVEAGGAAVIYQGVLLTPDGRLGGRPDFMIRQNDSYAIRDAKLAVDLDGHPEIPAQLSLYGLLAQQMLGLSVTRLEVLCGDGTLQEVPFTGPAPLAQQLAGLRSQTEEPDEAVGWSKCSTCGFFGHCWEQAVAAHDPAVVYGVTQNMRHALRRLGILSYDQIVSTPLAKLAAVKFPWGQGERRIGEKTAAKIAQQAQVLLSGELIVLAQPELPASGPVVYFDIESNPWDVGMQTMVYLWGLLVDRGDGSKPQYWGEVAQGGQPGDQGAWEAFLVQCQRLEQEFGRIPFVHYSSYEQTQMKAYLTRWGDVGAAAERVLGQLWDMEKKVVRGYLCLPVHSYGLKHTEKCAGFVRRQQDYGSLWSVGRYNAYLGSSHPVEREAIRQELLSYNREDCVAMRHVLEWARSLT